MNTSGNDIRVQIGLEHTYGTLAAMQVSLEVVSINVNPVPSINESKALVGAAMSHSISPGMSKVEGTMTIEVNPKNIGLLLGLLTGLEAAPALESGATAAWQHVFTPVIGGTSLLSFSLIVDKKVDVFGYLGNKINKARWEVDPAGYLLLTVDFIGQQELTVDVAIDEDIAYSTLLPFKFTNLSALVGTAGSVASTPLVDCKKFTPEYSNNLETERPRANGTGYTAEIDYQRRDMTVSLESDYSTATESIRQNFVAGTPRSLRGIFTHESEIETGHEYKLIFDMLYGYITAGPSDVPGPERLAIPFTVKAGSGTNGTVAITLVDDSNDGYITGAFVEGMSGGAVMSGTNPGT